MSRTFITKLIELKRDGKALSEDDISYFVGHLCRPHNSDVVNEIADPYQVGAMLMAMYIKGLNDKETSILTRCMKESGFVFSWPQKWRHLVVDKHSTGGVGDKVSLVLAPALAALGLKVPMISGRSLGHTGGTLDKLESIPGFKTELTSAEIVRSIEEIGCCIVSQTSDIVPADRILYHCRDITGTVVNQSLITASIVSKKLAEGTNALVYDVKFGKGSMFANENEALDMARKLVVASSAETKCSALFTCNDSPIGNAIGNTLEVLESIECLRERGPADLVELVQELGAQLLCSTQTTESLDVAKEEINKVLNNGKALKKFMDMMVFQGVTKDTAQGLCYGDAKGVLPTSDTTYDITYQGEEGYVQGIDAKLLADTWRNKMNNPSNLTSGFVIKRHVGDKISPGDVWLQVHHNGEVLTRDKLMQAIQVGKENTGTRKRVFKRIHLRQGEIVITEA